MDNIKLVVGFLGAIVVSVGLAVTMIHPVSPTVNVQPAENHNYGSATSPDISSPYLRWGNLGPIWNFQESPVATTTSGVFCSFLAPYGTSTLTLATWRPDNVGGSFGTGQTFDISTSTLVSGSSTPAFVIATKFEQAITWMPEASSTSAAPALVLSSVNSTGGMQVFNIVSSAASPTYVNFRVATSSAGTFATYPTGSCQAQFIQL